MINEKKMTRLGFALYKRFLLLFVIFMISACDNKKSITPYLKPKKDFKFNLSRGRFIDTVNFLFVVDDSGSMSDDKKSLADNITLFLTPLLDKYPYYNYNFAVTSMNVEKNGESFFLNTQLILESCFAEPLQFVKKSSLGSYFSYSGNSKISQREQLICALAQNIQDESRRGDTEHFFKPIQYIIDKADKEIQSNFFGFNQFFILFFISDSAGEEYIKRVKNNQSNLVINDVMAHEIFDRFKGELKAVMKNVRSYAVIPPKQLSKREADCDLDNSVSELLSYTPPAHVYSLIEKTDGLSLSICDKEWGNQLTQVSDSLLQALPVRAIELKEIPEVETMEVFFNGKKAPEDFESGWSWDIEKTAVYFGPKFNLLDYQFDSHSDQIEVIIRYNPKNLEILQNSE